MKKQLPLFMTIFSLIVSVTACSNTPEKVTSFKLGDDLDLLSDVSFDTANAVFDDFTNGVDYDKWIIGNGFWGQGNGGVIGDNVFYTEEGELLLRGNGLFYSKEEVKGVGVLKDGRNTGAALISKFLTGPGRYQVRMKPMGRQGACTAFWTFSNQPVEGQENDNHEIDIELPGGKSQGVISFKNVLNTNYITEKHNQSQDISVKDIGAGVINLNDGEYHTFGFDWYTNPGYIVYSIDGKVTAVSERFIPSLQTRIWLGAWFPNNAGFVGQSLFETDYLLVDWVQYIPFDETQPYTPFVPSVSVSEYPRELYPSKPIVIPETNLVANGDFEYIRKKEEIHDYGWNYLKLNTELKEASEVCYPQTGIGYQDSCGVSVNHGGYLTSDIDSVYEGYKYNIKFDVKTNGDDSTFIASFFDATGGLIEEKVTNISVGDWRQCSIDVNAPTNSYSMKLEIFNADYPTDTEMVLDNFKVVRIYG